MSFYFTGAKKSREVVFSVLRDACIDGDLSVPEAVEAAKDIFARNAIHFYKISSANGVISSRSNLSQKLNDDLDIDVSLVRLMWVDGSGQHRCRVSLPPSSAFLLLHCSWLTLGGNYRKMFTLSFQMLGHSLFCLHLE